MNSLNIIAVFLGGGIGSIFRYLTSISFEKHAHIPLPLASLSVNIVGSLILGFLFAFFMHKTDLNPALKTALTVGFCGGLTTFSTFSLEVFHLLEKGQIYIALGYIALSVIVCVMMIALGMSMGIAFCKAAIS